MVFKIPNFYKQMSSSPGPIKKSSSVSPLNVSYDAAYEAQSDEKKASQSKAEFKKAAEKYNMDNYGTKTPSKGIDDDFKSKAKTEKLKHEKEEYKKKREVTAKAKEEKAKVVKSDDSKKEIKVKTRKQKRSARRVDRLEAKAKSKGSLTPGQKKRLERNKAKAKGEKPEKTGVGKVLKSVVDGAKDLVSKDSPAKKYKSDAQRKAAHASMAEKK